MPGVTHTAINKAVTSGRLDPSKSLDEIRQDWNNNADPRQPRPETRRPTAQRIQVAPEPSDEASGVESGPAKLNGLSKFDVDLRDSIVKLRLRQLELQQKEKTLIPAQDARATRPPSTKCTAS